MRTHCSLKFLFILKSQFLIFVGLLVSKFELCSITTNNVILNNSVAKGPCWGEWSCLKIRTYLQFLSHHALKQFSLLAIAVLHKLLTLLSVFLWLNKVATSVLKFKTWTSGEYNKTRFLGCHGYGLSLSNIFFRSSQNPNSSTSAGPAAPRSSNQHYANKNITAKSTTWLNPRREETAKLCI